MIRCCICDDKSEETEKLREFAEGFSKEHPEFPLKTDVFLSPYDLLEAVRSQGGYDLYLLDIIMPHLSGIDIARRLREREEAAEILFLTVSREYAVEAFGVKASGYLLKPVEKEDFNREMLRCIQNLEPKENPSLVLKTREGLRKVSIRRIVSVESCNHRCICSLCEGTAIETPMTLSSLYEQLRVYPCFFQPHRAYIVNLDYVHGLSAKLLSLADGREIPVSRSLYRKLKEAYLNHVF